MTGHKICPWIYLESNNWELENEEKFYLWTQTDSQYKIFCPVVSLESRRWIIRKYVIGHKIGHKLENEHFLFYVASRVFLYVFNTYFILYNFISFYVQFCVQLYVSLESTNWILVNQLDTKWTQNN